ncbi:MAG: TerC family protein [Nitrospirae bacterium]|nr:TerC family protein [Nitrospirota bacterium]
MWDLGWFGYISFDLPFFSALMSIILINLILSGDNAVVIALAVRSLERKQRKWGIILGSGAAVVLRVVLTFFAAKLLLIPYLKILGGALIAWIAVKLFTEGASEDKVHEASNIVQAVKVICIADLVMSIDNVLAVAGASKGNMFLLLFGLGSSIPLVVGTSTLLSMLMDKYPVIIYIGAAVLGKVA